MNGNRKNLKKKPETKKPEEQKPKAFELETRENNEEKKTLPAVVVFGMALAISGVVGVGKVLSKKKMM